MKNVGSISYILKYLDNYQKVWLNTNFKKYKIKILDST